MRILKYTIDDSETTFLMPAGAKIVSVQLQREKICMWAECPYSETHPNKIRKFRVFLTGQTIPDLGLSYVGTVLNRNGDYVQHIYEVIYE